MSQTVAACISGRNRVSQVEELARLVKGDMADVAPAPLEEVRTYVSKYVSGWRRRRTRLWLRLSLRPGVRPRPRLKLKLKLRHTYSCSVRCRQRQPETHTAAAWVLPRQVTRLSELMNQKLPLVFANPLARPNPSPER